MTQQNRSTPAKDPAAKDPMKDLGKDKDLLRDKDKPPTTKSASQIEAEIGETRSAISSDIRELNDKFSSANVKEAAKDVMGGVKDAAIEEAAEIKNAVVDKAIEVKDKVVDKAVEVKDVATEKLVEAKDVLVETMEDVGEQAKRVGSASWEFTKANAVPLALLGAGLAWMFANSRTSTTRRRLPSDRLYRAEREDLSWTEPEDDLLAPAPYERTQRALSTPAGNGQGKTGSLTKPAARVGARARELKHEAAERLERAEHAIANRASQGVDYVQNKARRAGAATQEFAVANPILVALAAMATGVGIGMMLPPTSAEDRLLAPSREKFRRLVGDVKEAASDAAAVVKDTANESMNSLV